MTEYKIQARSLDIGYGIGGHDFWVLRDGNDRALAELHGLATDRRTGESMPIGYDEKAHSLRARHLLHDKSLADAWQHHTNSDTFIHKGQFSETVLTGSRDEVLARWKSAVDAVDSLDALDLDYPSLGFNIASQTINSNATYTTFGRIMGVPVVDFPLRVEPGLGNTMNDAADIERLRTHGYPVIERISARDRPDDGTKQSAGHSPFSQHPVENREAPTLESDPSAFLDRMLAAAKSGNGDTFRQMTEQAADGAGGRAMREQTITGVDRLEQLSRDQAERSALEEAAARTARQAGPVMG